MTQPGEKWETEKKAHPQIKIEKQRMYAPHGISLIQE